LGGSKASTSITLEALLAGAPPASTPVAAPPAEALSLPSSSQPLTFSATPTAPPSRESPQPLGSRFFPNPTPQDPGANSAKSPIPSSYTPPAGSRLLALGSRTSSATSRPPLVEHTSTFGPTLSQLSDAQTPPTAFTPDPSRIAPPEQLLPPRNAPGIAIRSQPTYPSFENQLRPPINLEEDLYNADINRRQAILNERAQFGLHQEVSPFDIAGQQHMAHPNFRPPSQSPSLDGSLPERSQGGSPYQTKGSRFAKFFDGKARDAPPMNKVPGSLDYASPSPHGIQRVDFGGDLYAGGGGVVDNGRAMEDIFAMLQNSAQVCALVSLTPLY